MVTSADQLALKKYRQRNSDGRMTFERNRIQDPPHWVYTDYALPVAADGKLTPDPILSETARAIRATHVFFDETTSASPAPDIETGWTPAELNPLAWYDPFHQTDENPLGVTTIQDRSGNGHHAVWTGPRNDFDGHPVGKVVPTINTLSGHKAWYLEETFPLVHRPYQTNIPSLPAERTYYAVVWNVQPNEGDSCMFGPGDDWTDRRGGTEIVIARRNDPQPLVTPWWSFYFAEDVDPPPANQKYHWSDSSMERNGPIQGIWGVTVQLDMYGSSAVWHWNGVNYAFRKENFHPQICIGGVTCDDDNGKNMMLFSSRQKDYPVVGIVGDIIIFDRPLPGGPKGWGIDGRKVEGYLAWKYGMQSYLTSNSEVAYGSAGEAHTYRWAPP